MSKNTNLYLGRAGQMAVMAEFLVRGWNVAIPEVDVGDDIFVIRDSDGNLSRIQVKTSSITSLKKGYSAQFAVSSSQLVTPVTPELTYVFVVRRNDSWETFLVIARPGLEEEHLVQKVGSDNKRGNVIFYISFTPRGVRCSGRDFAKYVNTWEKWTPIAH